MNSAIIWIPSLLILFPLKESSIKEQLGYDRYLTRDRKPLSLNPFWLRLRYLIELLPSKASLKLFKPKSVSWFLLKSRSTRRMLELLRYELNFSSTRSVRSVFARFIFYSETFPFKFSQKLQYGTHFSLFSRKISTSSLGFSLKASPRISKEVLRSG